MKIGAWIKENRNALIIGSIFFILNAFDDYIISSLVTLFASTSQLFSDYYFSTFSFGENYQDTKVFILIILMFFVVFVFKIVSDFDGLITNLIDNQSGEKKLSEVRLSHFKEVLDSTHHDVKFYSNSLLVLILLANFYYLYSVSRANIVNSFREDITILAPYIGEEKTKMLKSEWLQMENKEDFNEIQSQLENYKKENNLKTD